MTRYRARFYAYCGMSYDVHRETDDPGAVRRAVARFLRRCRRGPLPAFPYITQETGAPDSETFRCSYECPEPEGCAMVPDTAGLLVYSARPEPEPEGGQE